MKRAIWVLIMLLPIRLFAAQIPDMPINSGKYSYVQVFTDKQYEAYLSNPLNKVSGMGPLVLTGSAEFTDNDTTGLGESDFVFAVSGTPITSTNPNDAHPQTRSEYLTGRDIIILCNRLGCGINETGIHWARIMLVHDQNHVELK